MPAFYLYVMAALDVALANLALLASYVVRFEWTVIEYEVKHSLDPYLVWMALQSVVLPPLFLLRGLYRFRRRISRFDELQRVATAVSIAVVATTATSAFLSRDFAFSRVLIAFDWVLAILFIWSGRLGLAWLLGRLLRLGIGPLRVLIVGTGAMGQVILQRIRGAPELGYQVAGFVSDNGAGRVEDVPVVGPLSDLPALVETHRVGEVIIADPSLSHDRILDVVAGCDTRKVSVKIFPDVFQIISSEVSLGELNGLPMVTLRDSALRGLNLRIKRLVDLAVSTLVLVFFSPLMLLTALAIKLTSPGGPVFYIQERVGLDERPFPVIKFRTMVPNAEAQTGPVWARRSDPRVTPLGRLLRRFSLDELPQFVNVLLGQMSVVGPRPERPHFVQQFSRRLPRYLERHREKAGLTGWAQVNGLRGNVSIEERTAYDLWYVENWTLGLDFQIMLRTLVAIFRDRNAY